MTALGSREFATGCPHLRPGGFPLTTARGPLTIVECADEFGCLAHRLGGAAGILVPASGQMVVYTTDGAAQVLRHRRPPGRWGFHRPESHALGGPSRCRHRRRNLPGLAGGARGFHPVARACDDQFAELNRALQIIDARLGR